MKQRIYLASSWRNPLQPSIVALLRRAGHEVYDFRNPAPDQAGFSWSEIDPQWMKWGPDRYIEALKHPAAERGYELDIGAMEWATVGVLLLPCGRSAHLEAGWFAGRGKPVGALLAEENEPELMYKMLNFLTANPTELIDWLGQP